MNPPGRRSILAVADVSIANVIGGAERVLYEQCIRLARRGYDLNVMTRRLPSHRHSEAVVQGVRERRYEVDSKNPVLFLASSRHNGKKLFETLAQKNRFVAVVIHQPISAAGILSSRYAQEIKKIYICHSLSFEEYISRNRRPAELSMRLMYALHVQARKWMEKRALRQADQIVVLSRFTREKLEEAYRIPGRKIVIISGGVDLTRFKPTDDKEKIRQELRLPDSKLILFTVRNLVPRMGLENLIEALKAAVDYAPDLYLVIGGEGPLRDQLGRMAERLGVASHLRLEGFIPEESLPDYYRMADIFVLPTRELEGFGLVTLEAMASGVPVLGTPVGGTREILGGVDPSFLFRDSSSEAMAELILQKYHLIKEYPGDWEAASRKCRRFVEEHYSWEKHVDALEALF